MKLYNNFIGIDIGKKSFFVAIHGGKEVKEYDNDPEGIGLFIKENKRFLATGLSILETTGGYELRLLFTLCESHYAVHRANARNVKYFIRSFGNASKTDKLDAKALALYGYERNERLEQYVPTSKQSLALYELVQRRRDLKRLLVSEKNRIQAPRAEVIKGSCQKMIDTLKEQIDCITAQMNELIAKDCALSAKKEVLKTIPGIGDITAAELLVLVPELGKLTRREIASLAGLAPRANDSGSFSGYRSTGQGRKEIKPILFMSAMAARNSKTELKNFYNKLIGAGKKKMVALTALMRKLIVIANARVRDWIKDNTSVRAIQPG
jgi:transposase